MKQVFIALLLCLASLSHAQLYLDLEAGTSKSDYGFSTLRLGYKLNANWQLGMESQSGYYKYRFIDARAVKNGYVGQYKLFLLGCISENDLIRLDFFLKPGLRYMASPDVEDRYNDYPFKNSLGMTIEPGLLVTIKATDKLNFHTGVNMNMAFQLKPSVIFEQYAAGYILAGLGYHLGQKWSIYAQTMLGPTVGAGGDTEKFYWQAKLGLRYNFVAADKSANTILGF